MKCLFCENPVPLVQSLVQRGVPFCTEGHRKAYHADTQRLMLARLMESLKRYGSIRPEQTETVYEQTSDLTLTHSVRPKIRFHPLITS